MPPGEVPGVRVAADFLAKLLPVLVLGIEAGPGSVLLSLFKESIRPWKQ